MFATTVGTFVYGHDSDAYPSGLGRNIVDDIPDDKQTYRGDHPNSELVVLLSARVLLTFSPTEWLRRERERFESYVAELEKIAFTVTESTLMEGRTSPTLRKYYEPT